MEPKARELALHRWAIGRPIVLAMAAQDLAVMAAQVARFCDLFRAGRLAEKTAGKMPAPDAWLAMYRDRWGVKARLIETFLGKEIAPLDGDVMALVTRGALDSVRDPVRAMVSGMKLAEMPYLARVAIRREIEAALRYQYQEHLKALAEEIEADRAAGKVRLKTGQGSGTAGKDRGKAGKERRKAGSGAPDATPAALDAEWPMLDELFSRPEALFGVMVVLPCLLEYHDWPWTLYARACDQGDLQAAVQLLRIDKTLISDPRIGELAAELGRSSDPVARGLIADAFAGGPRLNFEPSRVYGVGAGAIARTAKAVGFEMRTEDLTALFDAGAKDRTGGRHLREVDWPESPEAQRQTIHRGKSFWDKLMPRDTESSLDCHADLGLLTVVSDRDEEAVRPAWLDAALQGAPVPQPKRGGGILARLRGWLEG